MKKIIPILSIMLLLASLLLAQTTPMHKTHVSSKPSEQFNPSFRERPMMMENMKACMEELKLTDKQSEKLETIRNAFEKTRNTLQAEMDNIQIDIDAAMKAENYSKAKELTKQLHAKQSLLEEARIDFQADRMKELTKEQKETLKKNMPSMMGRRNFPMGHGMHGNMGMMMQHKGQMQMNGEGCNDCGKHQNQGKGLHQNPDCKNMQEAEK